MNDILVQAVVVLISAFASWLGGRKSGKKQGMAVGMSLRPPPVVEPVKCALCDHEAQYCRDHARAGHEHHHHHPTPSERPTLKPRKGRP